MKRQTEHRSSAAIALVAASLAATAVLTLAACGGSSTPVALSPSATHALAPTASMRPLETPMPTYLSDLTPSTTAVGWGVFSVGHYRFTSEAVDKVSEGDPIVTHGTWYSHGLFAHAPSQLTYDIGGKYSEFHATLSMVEWITAPSDDGAVFVLKLDGAEVFKSEPMLAASEPRDIQVDVIGGRKLELITEAGANNGDDWSIWGDPYLR
jgi:hypothetical protein